MGVNTNYKFRGTVNNGATKYVPLTISPRDGSIGAQVAWLDATSSATLTIELTNYDSDDAPNDTAGSAWMWKDSGLVITGPTGTAPGSTIIDVDNIRQRRARLKIVASANCKLEVLDGEVA